MQPIIVGTGNDHGQALTQVSNAFEATPNGGTPLCFHITAVVTAIRGVEAQLRSNGQVATVIICTDGEASDGNIADALKPLKSMPVQVVLRLCTDDDNVVNYWNNIDNELELNMDVLDDLIGEAEEVNRHNPWLTYGEPLHLARCFGASMKEFDLLDEAALSTDQMKAIICFM